VALVNESDVRDGVMTRWAAAAVLDALIPAARVYADRIAEKSAWPAAAVVVREGEVTRCGGGVYLRRFTLTVVAQTLQALADERPIRAALTAAFGGTAANPTAGLTVPGATVLSCLEGDGGSRTEGRRLDGGDLLRLTAEFEILLWGIQ
jgi:hypothetical protein